MGGRNNRLMMHDVVAMRATNSDRKVAGGANNAGTGTGNANHHQHLQANKANNKIGNNETVEHTSPEMKKVCNLIKNSTPSSGD